MPLHFFLSNRLENLLEKLREDFFCSNELRKKTLVVASRGMKQWIKGRILAGDGSFFGVEILTLGEFLPPFLPSFETLAVKIFGKLPSVSEIQKYLEGKGKEEREVALALHLTTLFLNYKNLGFVPPQEEWQKSLFSSVLEEKEIEFPLGDTAFFGFSHLPKPLLNCLKKEKIPCYLLSPTVQFWEDLRKDDASLLGTLGRMGRVMASNLADCDQERIFSLPEEIASHPSFSGHLTGEEGLEKGKLTLLTALQADLLLLREGEKVSLPKDNSLEIHVAANKEREIEILKERLFRLMGEEGVTPGEILVMAKEIAPYLPLIKAAFQIENLPFKITFQEASLGTSSPTWTLLVDLLELKNKRMRSREVLSFFSSEIVAQALHLNEADLKGLETLIEEGAIFWGWDKEDRKRSLAIEAREISHPSGTWEEGFERVYQRILSFDNGQIPLNDPLPISFSQQLGKWIERLENLQKALFRDKSRSMKEWSLWMGNLIDTYLGKEGSVFDEILNNLALDDENEIPFPLFFTLFERCVKGIETTVGGNSWDSILFTSLGPMRAVPKRIVYLLGMEEASFPSKDPPPFGDLSLLHPERLSKRDQDRYAFVETLLSARERLILSYSTPLLVPPSEGEASTAVEELLKRAHKYIDDLETLVSIHPRSRFEERPLFALSDFELLNPKEKKFLSLRSPPPQGEEIKIRDLLTFAKDPARAFFKAHFETSLPWFESKLPPDEPFRLSSALLRQVKKLQTPAALEVSFEGRALKNGLDLLKERLAFLATKKPYKVFLHRDCQRALQDAHGNWILPPLKIDDHLITGSLGLVSEEGLLVDAKESEVYPLLLLSQLLPFKVPATLHDIESEKVITPSLSDPKKLLSDFLKEFLEGRKTPPPDQENETSYSALIEEFMDE